MKTTSFFSCMKKIAASLLLGCVFLLTACGGMLGGEGGASQAGDGAANSASQSSAVGAAAPSGGVLLEEADFDLYLNGAVAIDTPEVTHYDTLTNADDTPYVTNRGIGVGASLEEVLKVYADAHTDFRLIDENGVQITPEQPADPQASTLSQWLEANPSATRFQAKYELILVEGEAVTMKEFMDIAEDENYNPGWENYSLYIDVTDGKVSSLGVGYMTF